MIKTMIPSKRQKYLRMKSFTVRDSLPHRGLLGMLNQFCKKKTLFKNFLWEMKMIHNTKPSNMKTLSHRIIKLSRCKNLRSKRIWTHTIVKVCLIKIRRLKMMRYLYLKSEKFLLLRAEKKSLGLYEKWFIFISVFSFKFSYNLFNILTSITIDALF
jgi:hypothetical protein